MGTQTVRWILVLVAILVGVSAAAPGPLAHRVVLGLAAVALGAIGLLVRPGEATPEHVGIDARLPGDQLPSDQRPDDGAQADQPGSGVVHVGRTIDGLPVTVDTAAGVLVVGHGVLAVGVFAGITGSLGNDLLVDHELRVAHADDIDLPDLGGPTAPTAERTSSGVAIAVGVDARGDRVGSVVLVPDLRCRPRGRCPTVEVTRYGCTFRADPDQPVGVVIAPVLPALDVATQSVAVP